MLNDTFKLINGVDIPCVGFGTWQVTGETAEIAVAAAIRILILPPHTRMRSSSVQALNAAVSEEAMFS